MRSSPLERSGVDHGARAIAVGTRRSRAVPDARVRPRLDGGGGAPLLASSAGDRRGSVVLGSAVADAVPPRTVRIPLECAAARRRPDRDPERGARHRERVCCLRQGVSRRRWQYGRDFVQGAGC